MEPPEHNRWDKDLPSKGSGSKVEKEIQGFVRDSMRVLHQVDGDAEVDLDELDDFLPDIEDENSPEDGKPLESFPENKIDSPRISLPVERTKQKESTSVTDDGADEGDYGEGDHGAGGGDGAGGGSSTEGKGGSSGSGPPVSVKYRAFPVKNDGSEYQVILRGVVEGAKRVLIGLRASGDDIAEAIPLAKSRLRGGGDLPISSNGLKTGPVTLAVGKALKVDLKLVNPMKVAVEVLVNEVSE
jgi:hypothetical protein